MITVGNYRVTIGVLCFFIAFLGLKLTFLIAGIAFVVQGFWVHWGWGLANLFVPFAMFVFCFVHPRAAKVPLIITVMGIVWSVALLVIWLFATKT